MQVMQSERITAFSSDLPSQTGSTHCLDGSSRNQGSVLRNRLLHGRAAGEALHSMNVPHEFTVIEGILLASYVPGLCEAVCLNFILLDFMLLRKDEQLHPDLRFSADEPAQ